MNKHVNPDIEKLPQERARELLPILDAKFGYAFPDAGSVFDPNMPPEMLPSGDETNLDCLDVGTIHIAQKPTVVEFKPKYDAKAVLEAVVVYAEHVANHTLTAGLREAWISRYAARFKPCTSREVANHIEHVGRCERSADQIVLAVLGRDRVEAGLSQWT